MPSFLPLFDEVPEGFRYRESFISVAEEAGLLEQIGRVEFANFEKYGVVAKRRVAFFGASYSSDAPVPAIPDFLLPLRERLAAWVGFAPDTFAMALINEYRPGAPIGWHRDAPQYEDVAGVSLGSACRMKFRRYEFRGPGPATSPRPARRTTHELELAPRSAYVMTGPARRGYEHSIPPVEAHRYSVTFRSLRSR
jgi:alkylated DNA repair dioxygenase AlkB